MKTLQNLIQTSIGKELPKSYDMTQYVISKLKYQKICQILEDNEFECYVSSKISSYIQQDIYTCTSGKFNGEVVDIYYNYVSDDVYEISYSSQFHTGEYGTEPKIMNYIK